MKALILSATLIACSVLAYGQKIEENDVPSRVRNAFSIAYPSQRNVMWQKERGLYEASFAKNNQGMAVLFKIDGSISEVQTSINQNELPRAVRDVLARGYQGYIIKESSLIQSNGITSYQTQVAKGLSSYDLTFDNTGKLLRKFDRKAHADDEDYQ